MLGYRLHCLMHLIVEVQQVFVYLLITRFELEGPKPSRRLLPQAPKCHLTLTSQYL